MLIRFAEKDDLQEIAQIHMASWQDVYQGVMPDEVLSQQIGEGFVSGWQSTFERYPENLSVAVEQEGAIAGFCCAGPVVDFEKNGPFEFEIYGLHLRSDMRRKGIGRLLLREALRRANVDLAMNSAIVWTLRDLKPSRKFYEREGAQLVKSGTWRLGKLALPEVAYGWRKLDMLEPLD